MNKKISEIKAWPGFNRVETALLIENGINLEDVPKLFPGLGEEPRSLLNAVDSLSKLKESQTFIDFVVSRKNKKFCIIGDYDKRK